MAESIAEAEFRQSVLADVNDLRGETVVYAENGIAGVTIPAQVIRTPLEPVTESRSQRVEYGIEIVVSYDDVPNPVVQKSVVFVLVQLSDSAPDERKVVARRAVPGGWRLTL